MWLIFITNPAKKHLAKIPKEVAGHISSAIDEMRNNPLSGDLTKLSINNWRRRVGDYRIVFKLSFKGKTVFILDILRRTSTTY
jgi:mRNA-degrading endonuclease RelE of RelBE toxin-antitoxin system